MVFDVGTFVGNKRPTRLLYYEQKILLINLITNNAMYKILQVRETTGSYAASDFSITSVCEISKTVAEKK